MGYFSTVFNIKLRISFLNSKKLDPASKDDGDISKGWQEDINATLALSRINLLVKLEVFSKEMLMLF